MHCPMWAQLKVIAMRDSAVNHAASSWLDALINGGMANPTAEGALSQTAINDGLSSGVVTLDSESGRYHTTTSGDAFRAWLKRHPEVPWDEIQGKITTALAWPEIVEEGQ